MNYWLVKQEPEKYSFDDLERDGKTVWDGVRNYQARNNLALMRLGDQVLYYHSVSEKRIVGLAAVALESFPDPTDEKWLAVIIAPVRKLKRAVTLDQIKGEKSLQNIKLVKQSRLSVMSLTQAEFDSILELSEN